MSLHPWARAPLAGAAEKHGVVFRYDTTVTSVETVNGRATGVITADGERIPADVVVLNPDLPIASRDLLPPRRQRRLTYSPSCVVLHIGSSQAYGKIGHHNIHFGHRWESTFDEVINKGLLMSDPSLLVTNPSHTDPSAAPDGKHTYYVLAPAPNLEAGPMNWRGDLAERYASSLIRTLEQRGTLGPFGFRDALDYTRPNPGQTYAVVCTYMAHHVGMGLVALASVLDSQRWQHR